MAIKINLENGVKEAIEKTYIALKKGKKEAFDKVEIDDSSVSSTGVFHVKLRHLEDFIQYDSFKSTQKENQNYINQYAKSNELCLSKLQSYVSIWRETKKEMEEIGKYGAKKGHSNIINKLLGACGKPDPKSMAKKFKELLNYAKNDKTLKESILKFATTYKSFLDFENTNRKLVNTVNKNVGVVLTEIIKDPWEVYYHAKPSGEGDFVFCSDKYNLELVLVLKTQKTKDNAELFTAYKKQYLSVLNSKRRNIWQLIYTRAEGCKLK